MCFTVNVKAVVAEAFTVEPQGLSVSETLTQECLIKLEKREQLRKQGRIISSQQQAFSYWSKETRQTSGLTVKSSGTG